MNVGKLYKVALSFASEQRPYVEQVAQYLRKKKIAVFYDHFEQVDLWGVNLIEHLDNIYRNQAEYCVMFLSVDYVRKAWPRQERRSAQAASFALSKEYILPVRFDDTEVPGLLPTTGFIDGRTTDPATLGKMIVQKFING